VFGLFCGESQKGADSIIVALQLRARMIEREGQNERVLAADGLEKAEKCPLALASERRRRVESAPSPMKKDPYRNSNDSRCFA